MYGRLPKNIPSVTWKVVAEKDTVYGSYPVKEKTLLGVVDNSAHPEISVGIELQIGIPADARGPVPLVMEFGFIRSPFGNAAPPSNNLMNPGEPNWK